MMIDSDSSYRGDFAELLAGRALGELDATELQSLSELMTDGDQQAAQDFQLTVGALQLAFASEDSIPMPPSLRDKIAFEAPKYLSAAAQASVHPLVVSQQATGVSRREQLAWLVTAASLLLALGLWMTNKQPTLSSTVAMNAVQARAELIAKAGDRIEIAWANGTTPFETPVSGDVVWSNSLQKGFLRFVGMPVNDRTVQQYQLWIIDPRRDDKPIDGGVFDVTSEGEVVIPIDAKLAVNSPAAFAVTIEQPGGVVVSDQTRLPLLAKVPEA